MLRSAVRTPICQIVPVSRVYGGGGPIFAGRGGGQIIGQVAKPTPWPFACWNCLRLAVTLLLWPRKDTLSEAILKQPCQHVQNPPACQGTLGWQGCKTWCLSFVLGREVERAINVRALRSSIGHVEGWPNLAKVWLGHQAGCAPHHASLSVEPRSSVLAHGSFDYRISEFTLKIWTLFLEPHFFPRGRGKVLQCPCNSKSTTPKIVPLCLRNLSNQSQSKLQAPVMEIHNRACNLGIQTA